jgi:glutamate synthase domain-containing protein 3
MQIEYVVGKDGGLVATVTFSSNEVRQITLRHKDPQQWLNRLLEKEFNRVERQVLVNWTRQLMDDSKLTSIPTDKAEFLTLVESKANPVVKEEEAEPGLEEGL